MKKVDARRQSLRKALSEYRQQAKVALQSQIRHGRIDRSAGVGDPLEQADADNQTDLEFALAQMRAENLSRINEALARVETGQYGLCVECEEEIAESRLRALPFAARCVDCARRLEQASPVRSQAASDPDAAAPFAPRVWP